MDIVFERGRKENPRGHAILYFRSATDFDEIWTTYLVVLPIAVDVSKYVPPFLMSQVGELGATDLSAFAFPPAPEKVEGRQYLEDLASARDDDILFGGRINSADVTSAMMLVNDTVQWYTGTYFELAALRGSAETTPKEAISDELGVADVLYGLMSDSDKLNELTKLVGRLRFALEGGEEALLKEVEADINYLANHLPENHHVSKLITAAKTEGSEGTVLANLYLKRCFHLIQEEYVKLGEVETEISLLENDVPTSEAE